MNWILKSLDPSPLCQRSAFSCEEQPWRFELPAPSDLEGDMQEGDMQASNMQEGNMQECDMQVFR